MIKLKSKSKETKDNHQPFRFSRKPLIAKNQNKLLRTAEFRNQSNEIIPLTRSIQQCNSIRKREFSAAKNIRKESRQPEIDFHPLKNIAHEQRESKKHAFSRTFIDSKLKKKLQKYLLFLSLVNYSLRLSYQRPQSKRYKIFVGKGNNSKVIKTTFTNRFWWSLTNDESEANLIWTQKSKKKVFNSLANFQKDSIKMQVEKEPITLNRKAKIKVKKRDNKRIFFDEDMEGILTDKDKILIKQDCRRQNFMQQIKAYLKRMRGEKRKSVKVTHNHIENHRILTNKKQLYHSLKHFCEDRDDNVFSYVPLTFHFKCEEDIKELIQYQEGIESRKEKEKLMWIIKPGENSNRGCGIWISKKIQSIRKYIEKEKQKHPDRTFIVQKYISPFLFHRRKFDIRCFALVTATPKITAYFYPTGYIRTSSYEFSMKNCSNKYIHLTNDAVQKKANEYSKYQVGNKVRFEEFQKYLDLFHADKNVNFFTQILPALKQLVRLSIKSAKNFDDSCKEHTFEILGYDFMIDEQMQPWLIEINTNPCLETGCEILNDIIPTMIENAVKIAVDPVFKPPKIEEWSLNDLLTCSDRLFDKNKFELVYSQLHDQA